MSYNDDRYGGAGYDDQGGRGGYGGEGQGRGDDDQGGRGGYGGEGQGRGYGDGEGEGRRHHWSEGEDGGYGQEHGYGGQRQGGGEYDQKLSYGGERFNDPSGGYGGSDDDFGGAVHHAQQHAGDSGDHSLFEQTLGHLQSNRQNIGSQDLDENYAVTAHRALYSGGGGQSGPASMGHSSQSIGAGGAMEALQKFTGGGGASGGSGGAGMGVGSQGGGGDKNQFIGMAMAQASKMFDQQSGSGNVQQGANKQSAVQEAGEMALKMYLKSQTGGSSGGGGGLMGMASKFL